MRGQADIDSSLTDDEDDWNEAWSMPLLDDKPLLDDDAELALGQQTLLVPLHTMRLVDLLARKRALESRIAAASFVRAITHTSQVRRPTAEGAGRRNLIRRVRVRCRGVVRGAHPLRACTVYRLIRRARISQLQCRESRY